MKRTIFLAADHGGFDLKEALKAHLEASEYNVIDLGPYQYDAEDDYPDFVKKVVTAMSEEKDSLGVLACRSAQGVAIAANRNPHIRAAVTWDEAEAKKSREHNDANVLCLSGDHIEEATNRRILDVWLETEFSSEPRHQRRLNKIEEYFPI